MINQERLVNSFIRLVKIDSESGHESKIRNVLLKKLTSLGLKAKIDKKGNLYGFFKGQLPGKILLAAHMDTVKPGTGVIPKIKNKIITSSSKTILGADDKSGIAQIIEVISIIKQRKRLQSPSIQVIFTVEEEIGVKGARSLNKIEADFGFALDSGGPIGTVITSAPSHDTFKATIRGRSAHAGIEPEKGINAIVAVSKAISKMNLGRIDDETVANIGVINGGTATNIVPDEIIIKGEARSHKEKKLSKQIKHMKITLEKECMAMGATVNFLANREYNLFNINSQKKLISICRDAAKKIEIPLIINSTGGGSDANYLNSFGIPTAVLSTGMEKVHTTEERIKISNLVLGAKFLLAILTSFRSI